jgi:hypothetical protein
MTDARWRAEIELVGQNFTDFTPFATKSGFVGFLGVLRGGSRDYQVVIKVRAIDYPALEPRTYIDPKPEGHHWLRASGEDHAYLCSDRNKMWNPSKNTFANCILIARKYIHAFDPA